MPLSTAAAAPTAQAPDPDWFSPTPEPDEPTPRPEPSRAHIEPTLAEYYYPQDREGYDETPVRPPLQRRHHDDADPTKDEAIRIVFFFSVKAGFVLGLLLYAVTAIAALTGTRL